MKDNRYTIHLEFCGYPARHYVVRFCGEWVGESKSRAKALDIQKKHYEDMMKELLGV